MRIRYVVGDLSMSGTHAFVELHVDPDPKAATTSCLWVDQVGGW